MKYSAGIGACQRCGYSLLGLPERHVCPECGAEYDLRRPLWRPRIDWRRVLPMAFLLLLLGLLLDAFLVILLYETLGNMSLWLGGPIPLLAPLAWIGLALWRHRAGTYLVLQPDGVVIRRSGRSSFHRLTNITAAHPQNRWPFVYIETQGSPIYLTRFFETADEEHDFWQTVRRLRADVTRHGLVHGPTG